MKGFWFTEEFDSGLRVGLEVERTLFTGRSKYQRVEVFETKTFGKTLAIDGLFMTSVVDEANYHELLVQVPMCTAPRIENVLIVGGGDGGSAREVLLHPEVKRCVLVEIDGLVIEASKTHLPEIGTAWDDPRLEVHIEDGIEYVRQAETGSFDVILLDGSDPIGPAEGLFGEAFYRDVARLLPDDGVFALQSESPLLFKQVFLEIQSTLKGIFGQTHPYFRSVPIYGTGPWSWTFASRNVDPLALVPERVEHVTQKSRIYNADIHRAVFAVPQALGRELQAL
ncbi:MAG: polyamine aminopropyltransferase [Myxococcota bacterium]